MKHQTLQKFLQNNLKIVTLRNFEGKTEKGKKNIARGWWG